MAEVVGSNPIGSTAPSCAAAYRTAVHRHVEETAPRVATHGACGAVPGETMYGRRIAASLGEAARSGRRIALVGPAQAGKATLARTYVHRRAGSVLDLRDAATLERAAAAVDATLATLTPPVAVVEHHRIEGLVHRLAAVQDATDPTGQPWIVTSSVRAMPPSGSVTIEVASLTLDERDHAPAPRFVRRLLEDGVDAVGGWQPANPWSVQRLLERADGAALPATAPRPLPARTDRCCAGHRGR